MSRDKKVVISEMENKLEGIRQHRGKKSELDDPVIETIQKRGGKTEKEKKKERNRASVSCRKNSISQIYA